MADSPHMRSINQSNGRKRKLETNGSESSTNTNVSTQQNTFTSSNSTVSTTKKIKFEDIEPPHANPNSIEGVRDKNKALVIELQDKNRRISYLIQRLEYVFQHEVLSRTCFQWVRNQWFQLVNDMKSIQALYCIPPLSMDKDISQEFHTLLNMLDTFSQPKIIPSDLKIEFPEWFLAINTTPQDIYKDEKKGVGNPMDLGTLVQTNAFTEEEKRVQEELQKKTNEAQELIKHIFQYVIENNGKHILEQEQLQTLPTLITEKRIATEQLVELKDKLVSTEARVQQLECDVLLKEVERHQAARDYARLQAYIQKQKDAGLPIDLSALENHGDDINEDTDDRDAESNAEEKIAQKITEEHDEKVLLEMKANEKELMQAKENAAILLMKLQTERDKIDVFHQENEAYKAKEVAWKKELQLIRQEEADRIEQWKKDLEHSQDENMKLRHKLKDMESHIHEKWKKKLQRVQSDYTTCKSQLDESNVKNTTLRDKISTYSGFRDQLTELKLAFDALQNEKSSLEKRLAQETSKAAALSALENQSGSNVGDENIVSTRRELEETKINLSALQEENDTLVSEITAMSTEIKALKHSRKKLVAQFEEKRSLSKKLAHQVAKEEEAKAHCFEELAAVRLQVASLSTIHKQQKTTLDALQESLAAKDKELLARNEYNKTLDMERIHAEDKQREIAREAEVAKQVYKKLSAETTQKHALFAQAQQKPCESCEQWKKTAEEMEEKYLRASALSKSAGSTGEITDLERFELLELQKLVNCSVCQDRRKDVIISKCFHMFCKECIDTNLKARNRKCPTCKKMFGQDDVKSVWLT